MLSNLSRLPEILVCRRELREWLPPTLAYLRLHSVSYPYELRLRTRQVLTLYEPTDLVIFWLVFARRHYPVRASDRLILDVGANIGLFSIYAAREAPSARIIALEPFPDTFERLTQHVQANGLDQRVRALNCAVASAAGTQFMESAQGVPSQYRPVLSSLTNVMNVRHKGLEKPSGQTVAIRCETLAGLLESENIDHVDLLKMNIHGKEYEVLLSASPETLRRFGRIAVQYHEAPAHLNLGKDRLFEHLHRAGFALTTDADTGRGAGLAILTA